jgi:RNA 2',3'-cyclic 3'-phosphodiesterase
MSEKLRTFIAIDLSHEVRRNLEKAHDMLSPRISGVRWVRPSGIHLTLKFLGDVHKKQIDRICEALEDLAEEIEPIVISVRGAGAFPNLKRPRVLWVGLQKIEALADLAARVEGVLAPLGFEPEKRPFKPHLTLGRVKKPARDYRAMSTIENKEFGAFTAWSMVLYKSELTPGGAVYTVIEEFKLSGRR